MFCDYIGFHLCLLRKGWGCGSVCFGLIVVSKIVAGVCGCFVVVSGSLGGCWRVVHLVVAGVGGGFRILVRLLA